MTQEHFIEYLHDYDCELNQDSDGLFYKCKRRSLITNTPFQVTLPITGKDVPVKLFTGCKVCYELKVEPPQEFRDYFSTTFKDH